MIQSAIEEVAAGVTRYYAIYWGTVFDNADPEKLHRVRITIKGLVEPSDWAVPITSGGGSPKRGGHVAPENGADVCVWFIGGDVERPVYACGWWGKPDEGTEAPDDIDELSPAEAAQIQSIQFGRVKLTLDERQGNRAVSLQNTVTGDFITLDLENHALSIKMTTALLINVVGLLDMKATQIFLNERPVLPDSKGI